MLRFILFFGFILLGITSFSQKEYSNWYFGKHCALTFNNGYPEPLPEGNNMHDGASISDSLGNLLFYTDGRAVYDRQNRPTPNGGGLFGGHIASQGTLIVKLPLSNHLYYLFNVFPQTILDSIPGTGLSYSVFDIYLNNGFGDIIADKKNIPIYLPLSGYALSKITTVRHKNNRDIWIVTRNYPGNNFYSYLLTPEELSTVGILSQSFFNLSTTNPSDKYFGEVSISPDGSKMAAAYAPIDNIEFGSFNTESGKFYPLFIFQPDTTCGSPLGTRSPAGLEFSPDSKLLYLSHFYGSIDYYECSKIHQFDVSVADSALVKQSEYIVGIGIVGGLQTGPDGKIYGGLFGDNTLSVINNPNQKGIFCNYSFRSVPLGTGNREYRWGLPQMLQKYFSYINYTVACINQPTLFTPNIYPVPDSVYWNFGDVPSGANDTSTSLNSSHVYHTPGDYPVTLISYWPGGRSDTSVKVISVLPAPFPNIGDSAFICKGDSVTFESDVFDSYLWSSGDTTRSITVADTGTYWIEVTNNLGCLGRDTVRVEHFPAPVLGDSVLISPTACNGSTGAIRELTITGVEPVSVWWLDSYNNVVGTTLDIYNLPADWYALWAMDGRGCTNFIQKYYVPDAGNVLIQSVDHEPSFCDNNNGSITITAVTGLGDMLAYSIRQDEWLTNEGQFTNLEPGEYGVKVRVIDSTGCQAVWPDHITISNEPGPVVDTSTEPETGNNQDGTVTLTADGYGNLTYILYGIIQDTGYFTGLASGTYYYEVIDQNGCFTADSVTVGRIQGFILSAIAGNDTICFSPQLLTIPVEVTNFNGVKAFEISLRYDATKVSCQNYTGLNNQLEGLTIEVFPALERVVAWWTGSSPVTFSATEQLFELVFTANDTGTSQLAWDQAGLSWFEGENGMLDNVEYSIGEMQVNPPAGISVNHSTVCCEGGILTIAPSVAGTQPITYQWQLPDGGTDNRDMFISFDARQENSGNYAIKITDALGCQDSIIVNARVVPLPSANFPTTNDTIPFEQHFTLEATPGYFSYEWNTGDTTYYITGTEEGNYSVIIKTQEGCTTIDSAYLKDVYMPFYFNVPNAFTPNGDGLNDIFRPVATSDLIRQFSMVIYNRCGQMIFETTIPTEGWDGKDAPAGVYSWFISYSNHTGKVFKMRGSVSLLK
jgi:gliding motility-associated-like protein